MLTSKRRRHKMASVATYFDFDRTERKMPLLQRRGITCSSWVVGYQRWPIFRPSQKQPPSNSNAASAYRIYAHTDSHQ